MEPLNDEEYSDPDQVRQRKEYFLKNRKTFATFLYDESRECPVCVKPFEENEQIVEICCKGKHLYHEACLNELMRFSRTCVVCGDSLQPPQTKNA